MHVASRPPAQLDPQRSKLAQPDLFDSCIIPRPEEQGNVWQLLEVIGLHQLEAALAVVRLQHGLEPGENREIGGAAEVVFAKVFKGAPLGITSSEEGSLQHGM